MSAVSPGARPLTITYRTPKSAVSKSAPLMAAASLVPSLLEVIEVHNCEPAIVCAVHVAPELEDVYRYSLLLPATSFVPSLFEVMKTQFLEPEPDCAVQVTPESVDV